MTFRIDEERAAEVYVLYNEDSNGDAIDEEIIAKIITPYARSICRVNGSKLDAVQFISGDDREVFQENFEKTLETRCEEQGIDILQVAVTSATAPEEMPAPVRRPGGRQAAARPVPPGEDPAGVAGRAAGPEPAGRAEGDG